MLRLPKQQGNLSRQGRTDPNRDGFLLPVAPTVHSPRSLGSSRIQRPVREPHSIDMSTNNPIIKELQLHSEGTASSGQFTRPRPPNGLRRPGRAPHGERKPDIVTPKTKNSKCTPVSKGTVGIGRDGVVYLPWSENLRIYPSNISIQPQSSRKATNYTVSTEASFIVPNITNELDATLTILSHPCNVEQEVQNPSAEPDSQSETRLTNAGHSTQNSLNKIVLELKGDLNSIATAAEGQEEETGFLKDESEKENTAPLSKVSSLVQNIFIDNETPFDDEFVSTMVNFELQFSNAPAEVTLLDCDNTEYVLDQQIVNDYTSHHENHFLDASANQQKQKVEASQKDEFEHIADLSAPLKACFKLTDMIPASEDDEWDLFSWRGISGSAQDSPSETAIIDLCASDYSMVDFMEQEQSELTKNVGLDDVELLDVGYANLNPIADAIVDESAFADETLVLENKEGCCITDSKNFKDGVYYDQQQDIHVQTVADLASLPLLGLEFIDISERAEQEEPLAISSHERSDVLESFADKNNMDMKAGVSSPFIESLNPPGKSKTVTFSECSLLELIMNALSANLVASEQFLDYDDFSKFNVEFAAELTGVKNLEKDIEKALMDKLALEGEITGFHEKSDSDLIATLSNLEEELIRDFEGSLVECFGIAQENVFKACKSEFKRVYSSIGAGIEDAKSSIMRIMRQIATIVVAVQSDIEESFVEQLEKSLGSFHDSFSSRLDRMADQISLLKCEFRKKTQLLTHVKAAIVSAKVDFTNSSKECHNLKRALEEAHCRMKQMAIDLTGVQMKIQEESEKLRDLVESNNECRRQNSLIEQELESLTGQLETTQQSAKCLDASFGPCFLEIQSLLDDCDWNIEVFAMLCGDIAKLIQRIKYLQSDKDGKERHRQLKLLAKEYNQLKEENNRLHAEKARLGRQKIEVERDALLAKGKRRFDISKAFGGK